MLVLSRRENETIVFPSIQATIQLVQLKGKVARIGVIAPRDVPVIRGELAQHAQENGHGDLAEATKKRSSNHQLRNMLNTASVGLGLIRRQLKAGMGEQAEATIQMILEKVNDFQQDLEPPKSNRTPRALLVEDDDNERLLLAGFLRSSGFDVDQAGDGAEAIDYLSSRERPDVVLMDMFMPRCDGPTTVRTIRKDPRHRGLRIYAVSGAAHRFGLDEGPNGIDRWFQKPLDPERLVGELTRELQKA